MKAKVKYGAGRTFNLGNYESAKVDVGIELVCDDVEEDLDDQFKKAKEWVDGKIAAEEARIKGYG